MQINVGCGPFRAPDPWVNLDVVRIDGHIEPDIVVPSIWPETWGIADVSKVYMGHVLEHIQWELVPQFLTQIIELCVPGAEIAIVGPDIRKFVAKWKHDKISWDDVLGALENHVSFQPAGTWDGARHQWNCYGDRMEDAALHAGFGTVRQVPVNEAELGEWPVTSYVDTQCCVIATI